MRARLTRIGHQGSPAPRGDLEQGISLPAFVHAEFERYLRCGRLEHGFVRVKCTSCRHEHLVAFRCKCRGFWPSCGARFHRARVPTNDEIERLLDVLIRRIVRTLTRAQALVAGPEEEGAQPYLHLERPDDEALATLESAAVRYRIALGPIAGRKTLRLQIPGTTGIAVQAATPLTATRDGFSLNASVACKAEERKKLERLCRYVARPPLALERLGRDGDGLVMHRLKRPFRDSTTEFVFEPLDFLARLAALVPRPRSHLLRYHGVLAANARHRRLVVPAPTPAAGADDEPVSARGRTPMSWMQRLRYMFDIDLRRCPRCGAALRVLAVITDPRVIATILEHINIRAARAPPIASS